MSARSQHRLRAVRGGQWCRVDARLPRVSEERTGGARPLNEIRRQIDCCSLPAPLRVAGLLGHKTHRRTGSPLCVIICTLPSSSSMLLAMRVSGRACVQSVAFARAGASRHRGNVSCSTSLLSGGRKRKQCCSCGSVPTRCTTTRSACTAASA